MTSGPNSQLKAFVFDGKWIQLAVKLSVFSNGLITVVFMTIATKYLAIS